MAGLASLAEVAPWIVLDRDRHEHIAVGVLLEAVDHRRLAIQHHVEHVTARPWPQPHARTAPQLHPADRDRIRTGPLELFPVAHGRRASPNSRIVP